MDSLATLFSSDGFMPHGHCYLWDPGILWLHIVSDAAIALAYFSIPFTLLYFVRRRRDLAFHWMFICFAVFIVACGATHLMEIWVIWHPVYWLSGAIKALTALASVPTAVLLVKLIPAALRLPNPSSLRAANAALEKEIGDRVRAENEVRQINSELEQRVQDRTARLENANKALEIGIAERHLAEDKLKASTKEIIDLKAALDEHAIVAITDPRGKITYVNDKFCAISKYSRAELIGQDHRIINSGFHPKEFIADLWHTIASGHVWHGEIRNKAKDGSFYWVDTTIVPFLDDLGRPHHYVAIRADTTERKNAEETIHELNSQLERRVVERTAQLEAANLELEAFSYSVSHDLRAPLRAIDGFSQAVLEDFGAQLPPDGKRYLGTIRSGAQRMGSLIDDLLAFSRLNRHTLVRQLVNTDLLMRGVLEELGSPWTNRQVDLRIGELTESEGDPALLKQVWINLLSNALKYTRNRELAVIEIGVHNRDGVQVFFVRDNGTGFDMKYVEKLFGVFQRLHRVEDFEGTGVGLAIVQRIVHRHGGKVWAEAAPDQGATFYFTLKGEPAHG